MNINTKQHIAYSKDPLLFMKERWLTFDVFDSMKCKHITPFPYQLEFIKNVHNINYNWVIKTRQMHVSSMMALYISWYVIFNSEKEVFILSNSSDSSKRILDQIKIIIQDYSPDDITTNNRTELRLKNGCRIKAAAPTADAGKACAIDFLYIDEAAYMKDFEYIYAAIAMCVFPNNGKMVVASTPKDNSTFNKIFLGIGTDGYCNSIRLHWSIHPIYSKGIEEDRDRESPFQYSSPWFNEMWRNIYRGSISQTEQELECVVRYQDETNKVKTISLRVDGDFYKKIQDRLHPGETTSDYIRSLIEKDLRFYL